MPRKAYRPKLEVRIVGVPCADYDERVLACRRLVSKAHEDLLFNQIVDEAETSIAAEFGITLDEWRRRRGIRIDPIAELLDDSDQPPSSRRRQK